MLGLILLAFLPALRAGWIWDDNSYVTRNATLIDAGGLQRIWVDPAATPQYYPMVYTTFWVEHHLWGLRPGPYHLINLLLHAADAILLWLLLRRLALPGAFLAAALFAVHPVQVESVAWVTERKNVLSALFYLLSLFAYLRSQPDPADPSVPRRPRLYAVSLLLFALALLSKTVTVSLPVTIVLLLWWKRRSIGARDLIPLIPFFALAVLSGLATVWLEKYYVGASGQEWRLTPLQRILLAGRALWFYSGKLVWPAHLTFVYPRWTLDAGAWWQWLFPASAAAVLVLLWRWRHRIGRGPLAATLIFAGTLFPTLGFFDVYLFRFSYVADHFQYHASAAIYALLAAAVAMGVRRLPRPRMALRSFGAAAVILLAVLTWKQTLLYKDAETLWRQTIRMNPGAWMPLNNLAVLLLDQERAAEAVPLLNQAIALKPDYAEAYNNRGSAWAATGQLDRAMADISRAVALQSYFPEAYSNRGKTEAALGRIQEAMADYDKAIEQQRDFAIAYYNRATTYASLGRFQEAIEDYSKAIGFRPAYPEAYCNRGGAEASLGTDRHERAIQDFSRALALDPSLPEAYCNRGRLYAASGRYPQAIGDLTRAIQQRPAFAQAFALRAACRLQTREYEGAWDDVRALRRLGAAPPEDLVRQLSQASGRTE